MGVFKCRKREKLLLASNSTAVEPEAHTLASSQTSKSTNSKHVSWKGKRKIMIKEAKDRNPLVALHYFIFSTRRTPPGHNFGIWCRKVIDHEQVLFWLDYKDPLLKTSIICETWVSCYMKTEKGTRSKDNRYLLTILLRWLFFIITIVVRSWTGSKIKPRVCIPRFPLTKEMVQWLLGFRFFLQLDWPCSWWLDNISAQNKAMVPWLLLLFFRSISKALKLWLRVTFVGTHCQLIVWILFASCTP